MTNAAQNYQTTQSATTDGLEELFTVQHTDVQDTVQDDSGSVQDSVQQEITVVEAAKLLSVDRRSIVRLLNWQKLSGHKDNRGNWLVNRQSVLERLKAQDTVLDTDQDTVQVEVQDSVLGETENVLDVSMSPNSGVQDSVLDVIKQQSEQLKQAYTYLDAATARILYLQEQLEQKDREIKLLTDSQHKRGWWARFSSWFFQGR